MRIQPKKTVRNKNRIRRGKMDDTSLRKLTTEEKVTILEKEIARVEGRIGEFLKLLVSHYPPSANAHRD